jgi:deoxyadenosine/deoxycytidine kinase
MALRPGSYIALEGSIGVGKSSLARILAEDLDAELVLEDPASNPFLPDFYRDPARWAFQTQLTFLLQRHRQLSELRQINLFNRTTVSDYLFDKDRLFAAINLQEREFRLYASLANSLQTDIPTPDLVIYLQANVDRLMANIRIRDIHFERQITPDYLRTVCEVYNQFFTNWDRSPLLIVNAARIDFVNNLEQRERLLKMVRVSPPGTTYFNPEA